MLVAVLLLHALNVPVHLVFARQLATFGEVVDLLPAVKHALLLVAQGACRPLDQGFLPVVITLFETVVFQGLSHQLRVTRINLEVVSAITCTGKWTYVQGSDQLAESHLLAVLHDGGEPGLRSVFDCHGRSTLLETPSHLLELRLIIAFVGRERAHIVLAVFDGLCQRS